MDKSIFKYLTLIFIVLLFAFIFFMLSPSNTEKEDELGKIKTVSTKGTEEVNAKNLFTPIENDFGYEFKKYTNPRAKMEIFLPSTWDVDWKNDREINVLTPKDDKYFPETSFLIRYDFGASNVESAKDMIDTFKNQLYKSEYIINGKLYNIFDYKDPDIKTDTRYTNGHDNAVACAETEKIRLKSSNISSSDNSFNKFDYYINWENIPCVISCIVKKENAKKARNVLSLIASNIKYCEQGVTKTGKTASLNNEFSLQLTLPHQFKPVETENGNFLAYNSPKDNRSAFSGMSVLMFDYPSEEGININDETIMKKYGKEWFRCCDTNMGYFTPTFYSEEKDDVKIKNVYAAVYDIDYTLIANSKNYNTYYIPGETWKMRAYVLYGDDSFEVIVINYQEGQEKQMEEVCKVFKG